MDAEYFSSDAADLEEALERDGIPKLGDRARIVEDRLASPSKTDVSVVTYVEIGDVDLGDGFVSADHIEWRRAPSRARLRLTSGLVGLSSVRPNRSQVFLATADLDAAVASTGFVTLRPVGDFSAAELFVQLKSRWAVTQLVRRARASMYPVLHPPDILEIRLPKLAGDSRRRVRSLVEQAAKARREALTHRAKLESVATRFFDGCGGATLASRLRERLPSTRKLSSLGRRSGDIGRIDGEFHHGAFDLALREMRAAGAVSLLNSVVADAKRGRAFTAADLEVSDRGGAAVIQVGAITELGVRWAAVPFANGKRGPTAREKVYENDVVLNAAAHEPSYIAHRVGVVEGVTKSAADRLMTTSHVMYLRLADADKWSPHYLAAFLRHPLGAAQIRRCIRGVRAEVYPEDVLAEVLVPVPPRDVMDVMATAAANASRARWRYHARIRDAIDVADQDSGA